MRHNNKRRLCPPSSFVKRPDGRQPRHNTSPPNTMLEINSGFHTSQAHISQAAARKKPLDHHTIAQTSHKQRTCIRIRTWALCRSTETSWADRTTQEKCSGHRAYTEKAHRLTDKSTGHSTCHVRLTKMQKNVMGIRPAQTLYMAH